MSWKDRNTEDELEYLSGYLDGLRDALDDLGSDGTLMDGLNRLMRNIDRTQAELDRLRGED